MSKASHNFNLRCICPYKNLRSHPLVTRVVSWRAKYLQIVFPCSPSCSCKYAIIYPRILLSWLKLVYIYILYIYRRILKPFKHLTLSLKPNTRSYTPYYSPNPKTLNPKPTSPTTEALQKSHCKPSLGPSAAWSHAKRGASRVLGSTFLL